VDKKILSTFEEDATKFIEEVGAKEALCMALAYISDTSNSHLASRSFLTGEDGIVTYILRNDRGINNVSYAHKLIQNNFSADIGYKIKGMKLLRSGEGIVFDISEENAEVIDQEYKEQSCTSRGLPFVLERASELPEIEEGHRYNKSSHGYGKRGGKNGGFTSARNHYNQSFQGHGYNDKEMTRNYNKKPNDSYDSHSMRSGKGDFNQKEVSDISFGGRPKFFTRNHKAGGMPSHNTDGESFGRNEFGRGRGRGSRGGYRGRGRGRGREY